MYYRELPVLDRQECTGCEACFNVCRADAITLEKDEETAPFKKYLPVHPIIDAQKCARCYLCLLVCPTYDGQHRERQLAFFDGSTQSRQEGLYADDQLCQAQGFFASHQNPAVKRIYEDLGATPCGQLSHTLFHTEHQIITIKKALPQAPDIEHEQRTMQVAMTPPQHSFFDRLKNQLSRWMGR